jgi:hypothetical protein
MILLSNIVWIFQLNGLNIIYYSKEIIISNQG